MSLGVAYPAGDPMVLVATVVYASCIGTPEQRSQIDVANAAGVTDVTIRNILSNKITYSSNRYCSLCI